MPIQKWKNIPNIPIKMQLCSVSWMRKYAFFFRYKVTGNVKKIINSVYKLWLISICLKTTYKSYLYSRIKKKN